MLVSTANGVVALDERKNVRLIASGVNGSLCEKGRSIYILSTKLSQVVKITSNEPINSTSEEETEVNLGHRTTSETSSSRTTEAAEAARLPQPPAELAVKGVTDLVEASKTDPNNSSTTIQFDLPKEALVTLEIYNISGAKIRTLVRDRAVSAGRYSVAWDGREEGGKTAPSGVYFCRIDGGDFHATKKMALVR